MDDLVGLLVRELTAEGRNAERELMFYLVVPYDRTAQKSRAFVTRCHIAYLKVRAIHLKEAKEIAYDLVDESCRSAELRREIFSAAINDEQIREATSQERKKYF